MVPGRAARTARPNSGRGEGRVAPLFRNPQTSGTIGGSVKPRYLNAMRRPTPEMRIRAIRLERRRLRTLQRCRQRNGTPVGARRRRAVAQRAVVNRKLFEEGAINVPRLELEPSRFRDVEGRVRRCLRLKAPADFRLEANPDEILSFVYELRRQVFIHDRFRGFRNKRRPPLYVDLDAITHIDLEGALVLTAEFQRISLVYKTRPFLDDANWNRGVRAILHGLGLYEVVQAMRAADAPDIDDIAGDLNNAGIAIVPFVSCHEADPAKAQTLRLALREHCATTDEAQLAVYDCLVEAFTNAVQHAYRDEIDGDGLPRVKRWWAGALVDKRSRTLLLAVYDQGVGIPQTLTRRPWWRSIKDHIREDSDAGMIEGALEYGRSGTIDPEGRGNGLWRMCELTNAFHAADVRFTSLKGQVLYPKNGPPQRNILKTRFAGTMVRWRAMIAPTEELNQ